MLYKSIWYFIRFFSSCLASFDGNDFVKVAPFFVICSPSKFNKKIPGWGPKDDLKYPSSSRYSDSWYRYHQQNIFEQTYNPCWNKPIEIARENRIQYCNKIVKLFGDTHDFLGFSIIIFIRNLNYWAVL